jgi:hypothetical protein
MSEMRMTPIEGLHISAALRRSPELPDICQTLNAAGVRT